MRLKNIFLFILASLFLNSCRNYDELIINPNRPTTSSANLILTSLEYDIYNLNGNSAPWNDASKYAQYWCTNYTYYGNQDYSWTTTPLSYTALNNVAQMEAAAIKGGASALNPYSALGKFFRAYYFYNMTMRVGDIPMTDALKASTGVYKAKYDTQKDVLIQVNKWLEDANSDLASLIKNADQSLLGDFYFSNNLKQWQRIVNAMHLRVLIATSAKEADLNAKAQFAAILSDANKYPLLTSMSDDMALQFNATSDKYPTSPDNLGFDATRRNMADTYVGNLAKLNDPRVFVTCTPADSFAFKNGYKANDVRAYVGAPSGENLSDMYGKAQIGLYSLISRTRYYAGYTSEPAIIIGYNEMLFNIAEGINRGWASGNAVDYYNKAIVSDMAFYGYKGAAVDAYLAQALVAYKGNNADGLNQILIQKYLAFFQNSGWESFYNQRRTGVPKFDVGPANVNGKIPVRWRYPLDEKSYNTDNYNAAVKSQYADVDDTNSRMWLIK